MLKNDWKKAIKKLEDLRKIAENNIKLATDQLEELLFNISNYSKKIETFK